MPRNLIEEAKQRAVIAAVKETAKEVMRTNSITLAFEEMMCSCLPLRHELADLDKAYAQEQQTVTRPFDELAVSLTTQITELQERTRRNSADREKALRAIEANHKRRYELRKEIAAKDLAEHGPINREAATAKSFFEVWLMEKVMTNGLEETKETLPVSFAQAWIAGWRPQKRGTS